MAQAFAEDKVHYLATCNTPAPERDPSYPQGGFMKLGPIPEAEFDVKAFIAGAEAPGEPPKRWPLQSGQTLTWALDDALQPPYLDPEVLRTTGRWISQWESAKYYLLWSTLHAPRARKVGFRYQRGSVTNVLLNGADISGGAARLRRGANALVLVYRARNRVYDAEHAGCFLRVVEPGTEVRVKNVRFEAPQTAL